MKTLARPFGINPALRFAAFFTLAALLIAACGGDSDSNGADGNTGGEQPAPTRAAGGTPSTGGGGGGAITTSSLNDLDSYRFELRVEGTGSLVGDLGIPDTSGSGDTSKAQFNVKGAWIKPDKAQLEINLSGLDLKQTVIGNQQWTTIAGMTQGPERAEAPASELALAPVFVEDSNLMENLDQLDCGGSETVNGINSVVCEAGLEDFEALSGDVSGFLDDSGIRELDRFNMKIWVARDGGYPVRMDLDMEGTDTTGGDFTMVVRLSVSDVNKVGEITP